MLILNFDQVSLVEFEQLGDDVGGFVFLFSSSQKSAYWLAG